MKVDTISPKHNTQRYWPDMEEKKKKSKIWTLVAQKKMEDI